MKLVNLVYISAKISEKYSTTVKTREKTTKNDETVAAKLIRNNINVQLSLEKSRFEAIDHCISLGFPKSEFRDKKFVQVYLGSDPRKQSGEVRLGKGGSQNIG